MLFQSYQTRKRERSPTSDSISAPYNSPALPSGVISPTVDVLAKRQRMGTKTIGGVLDEISVQEQPPLHDHQQQPHVGYGFSNANANTFGHVVQGQGHGYGGQEGVESERVDPSRPYVDKRRTRQWEQVNAPVTTLPFLTPPNLPEPVNYVRSNSEASLLDHDVGYFASPATHHRAGPSQPSRPQFKHHMSSSPIRHQPPGSSPFKSSGPSSQNTIRGDFRSSGGSRMDTEEDEDDEDDAMDQEELRRDWGEHYARPNELLHSLHRSRQSQQRIPPVTPHIQPHDRRSDHMLSSPFIRPDTSRSNSYRGQDDIYTTPQTTEGHVAPDSEVHRRYEEANRLLGEMDLDRRQRHHTE